MKTFDAVKTIREIRDRIYEQTKDKTDEELIDYYNKKAEQAKLLQKESTHSPQNSYLSG
ncbi:MAG: hypothetical protein JW795_12185 [Chitinivibrionales bacterium]|nr:hypothetical protein [Chitinivibrionales bacterium]